jgi:hypothetical protein
MRNHHLITSTIDWGYLCSEHVEVKKSTPTVGEPAYAFSNRWTPLFGNPAFASRIRKLHRTMLRRIRLLADRLASVKNHFHASRYQACSITFHRYRALQVWRRLRAIYVCSRRSWLRAARPAKKISYSLAM